MRKRSTRRIVGAVLLASVIAAVWLIHGTGVAVSPPTATPISLAVGNVGAADTDAIRGIIVQSYAVRTAALKSGDITQFPTVFVDDPSFPLSADQVTFVSNVRARYGNAVQSITGNGNLAYESARVLDRQQSLATLGRVQATAKAQGRALTADELRSVTQVDGYPPAPAITDGPLHLTMNSVTIVGTRADVNFDTAAATYHAILVNTADGWRIASEDILRVHL